MRMEWLLQVVGIMAFASAARSGRLSQLVTDTGQAGTCRLA